MRRMPAGVVLAMAVVWGAACGGGGTSTLDKPALIQRADALCAKSNRAISAMPPGNPSDPESLLTTATKVLALQRDELRELRRLRPPRADRPVIERWLALVDQTLDEGDAVVRATRAEDQQAIDAASQRANELDARAREIATHYGLRQCARSS